MSDRSSDPFQQEVLHRFSFLEHDFGFSAPTLRKDADAREIISFESKLVYVHIFLNTRSTEVIMLFGRKGVDDQPDAFSFEPGDLISLETCKGWKWIPENKSPIFNQIAEFARLLNTCGKDCLLGDQASFETMKQARLSMISNWKDAERIKAIRTEAEEAWSRRDYSAVVRLYSSIGESITPIETTRLAYARKRV